MYAWNFYEDAKDLCWHAHKGDNFLSLQRAGEAKINRHKSACSSFGQLALNEIREVCEAQLEILASIQKDLFHHQPSSPHFSYIKNYIPIKVSRSQFELVIRKGKISFQIHLEQFISYWHLLPLPFIRQLL